MVKYKQYFQTLLDDHKDLLDELAALYSKYQQDPEKNKDEYEDKRKMAYRMAKRYEDTLCGKTERGKYASFSTALGDKFWGEVVAHYPYIATSAYDQN